SARVHHGDEALGGSAPLRGRSGGDGELRSDGRLRTHGSRHPDAVPDPAAGDRRRTRRHGAESFMTNGEMAPSQLCAAPGPSGPTPADGRMRGLRSLWVATARALVCGGLVALMPSGATAQGTGGALPRI